MKCQYDEMLCAGFVVPQVVQQGATDKFLAARRADQQRALAHLHEDAGLDGLQVGEMIHGFYSEVAGHYVDMCRALILDDCDVRYFLAYQARWAWRISC